MKRLVAPTIAILHRKRRVMAAALLTTAAISMIHPGSALAVGETVTAPPGSQLFANTADQDPGDFVIDGFGSTTVVTVGVSLVDPPPDTTFRFPTTIGLTPSFGYVFTSTLQSISFTGTQADANAALASLLMSTGTMNGPSTLSVTAALTQPNTYFNPLNGHFYKYVPSSSITFASAAASAATLTLHGSTGYIVTITDAQENDFIKNNVNAANIWIGASDSTTEGNWTWVNGPEAGLNFWVGTGSGASPTGTSWFSNWAPFEPNDNGGSEDAAVTNWRGTLGLWNDIGQNSLNFVSGYLAEFSGLNLDVPSATWTATNDYVPRNVTVLAGDSQVAVTWDEPYVTTVSGYTVTASPGGRTCTVSGSASIGNTCTVTGLTNSTTYTFTVSASHTSGSSDSVSPPATPSGQAGTIDSPLPTTGASDGGGTFALWALTAGLGVIVIARRRQRI